MVDGGLAEVSPELNALPCGLHMERGCMIGEHAIFSDISMSLVDLMVVC